MKKKLISAVLILTVLSCVFLSACASKENAIVGKWKHLNSSGVSQIFEFSKNKICKYRVFSANGVENSSHSKDYVWKYDSEEKYFIIKTSADSDENIYKVIIEKKSLKLILFRDKDFTDAQIYTKI